jgi:hypothetical protein
MEVKVIDTEPHIVDEQTANSTFSVVNAEFQ